MSGAFGMALSNVIYTFRARFVHWPIVRPCAVFSLHQSSVSMSASPLSWSLLFLFPLSFFSFLSAWLQLTGQLLVVKMFSLKSELVYSDKIPGKKKDQYKAWGWCGDSGWPQNRHSEHSIQLPSAQLEILVESLIRKLISRGPTPYSQECKSHCYKYLYSICPIQYFSCVFTFIYLYFL